MRRKGELIFTLAIVSVSTARLRLFARLRLRFARWVLFHDGLEDWGRERFCRPTRPLFIITNADEVTVLPRAIRGLLKSELPVARRAEQSCQNHSVNAVAALQQTKLFGHWGPGARSAMRRGGLR